MNSNWNVWTALDNIAVYNFFSDLKGENVANKKMVFQSDFNPFNVYGIENESYLIQYIKIDLKSRFLIVSDQFIC